MPAQGLVYHPLQVPVTGAQVLVDLQQHRGGRDHVVHPADRHPPPVIIHTPAIDHLAHVLSPLPGERGGPSLFVCLDVDPRLGVVQSAHGLSVAGGWLRCKGY